MSQDELRPQASWLIGKATESDLRVPEPTVSSRHCRLTRYASGFTVEDLGSTNGTFVNGQRIPARRLVPLRNGTQIDLAHSTKIRVGFERKKG